MLALSNATGVESKGRQCVRNVPFFFVSWVSTKSNLLSWVSTKSNLLSWVSTKSVFSTFVGLPHVCGNPRGRKNNKFYRIMNFSTLCKTTKRAFDVVDTHKYGFFPQTSEGTFCGKSQKLWKPTMIRDLPVP